jgi:HSP20 family protein
MAQPMIPVDFQSAEANVPTHGGYMSMRREMNDLLRRFFGDGSAKRGDFLDWKALADDGLDANMVLTPDTDIYEDKDSFQFRADLPGMGKDDISLDFADGVLTLKGERLSDRKTEDDQTARIVERHFGSFSRQYVFPAVIDENKIKADFTDGVLRVTLPKAVERVQPVRNIKID